MHDNGLQALELELDATAPAEVAALLDAHLADLAGAIRAARHRQTAELAAAGDAALQLIPRVLRRPILKMFG